jgi:hypothetical protein
MEIYIGTLLLHLASANTTAAFLPPSSRLSRFIMGARTVMVIYSCKLR